MRHLSTIAVLLALAAAGAQSPPATDPPLPAPDARLVYESDTRAYYRPCG
ncbi:MAG TPA: hypothetical protein VF247_04795 [Candidatus Krumholzibacteria bacterium]